MAGQIEMTILDLEHDERIQQCEFMLAAVLMTLTVFRVWTADSIGLHPDEAYYWLWSMRPSAGYYDHPPMIAWWIWLSSVLFGHTLMGVRAVVIASTFVSSILVFHTMLELGANRRLACRAALWFNAMLLVGFTAFVATPDDPSMLFWAATVLVLARLRRTGHQPFWLLVGLLAGLGCVSKYTNFFLGPGILLWLAVDNNVRRNTSPLWLLAGGGFAMLVFLPVLLWNWGHGWVSFSKQFGRIEEGGFTLHYLTDFWLGQFGLINPALAVFVVLAVRGVFKGRSNPAQHVLLATSAPLLVYMMIHSLHDRVQANWLSPLYPGFAMIAAFEAGRWHNLPSLNRLAQAVLPVGLGLPSLLLGYAALSGEAGLPFASPLDPLVGWASLASRIEQIRQDHAAAWIATADYGVTGELAFYAQDPAIVQEVLDRDRYSFRPAATVMANQPGLLVLRVRDRSMANISACFRAVADLGQITRNANGRVIERYDLFKVSAAEPEIATSGCNPVFSQLKGGLDAIQYELNGQSRKDNTQQPG